METLCFGANCSVNMTGGGGRGGVPRMGGGEGEEAGGRVRVEGDRG